MSLRAGHFVGMTAALMLAASTARAQSPANAETLVQHGIELRKSGNDEEALHEFRRAFELSPTARVRAQIGAAEQALGLWVEAERDLALALNEASDEWIARHVEQLTTAIASVRKHLASLKIETSVAGAEIWINGTRVGTATTSALRIVSGTTVLEVRAAGYIPVRRTIEAAPGTELFERVDLVAAEQPISSGPIDPKPPPPSTSTRTAAMRWAGLAVGAVGLVGVGVGAYFGVRTLSDVRERDLHCNATVCFDEVGLSLDRDARTSSTISTVTLILGGALLTTGIVLFAVGSAKGRSVSAMLSPSTLWLGGSF